MQAILVELSNKVAGIIGASTSHTCAVHVWRGYRTKLLARVVLLYQWPPEGLGTWDPLKGTVMQREAGNQPHETMAATSKIVNGSFVCYVGALVRNSAVKYLGIWNVVRSGCHEIEASLLC